MRTILLRILLVSILAAVCLGGGYFVGYKRGHVAAVHDWDVYDLHVYPSLYKSVKRDDTNQLEMSIRALIISRIDYYDTHFSGEAVTDDYFAKDLAVAHAMDKLNRAEWLKYREELYGSNRVPNTALEPTPTAP
jgi:hypothetical protein